jgi:hypothetical protein
LTLFRSEVRLSSIRPETGHFRVRPRHPNPRKPYQWVGVANE